MGSQPEYEFDVFVSYSSKDKKWVRTELLKVIEDAGLKAFIDFRDFTPGAPSIKEMERGVVSSRRTLVILTPDYLVSAWAEIENIMVQTLDPANRDLRLIPLLKSACEEPPRIGALTHIDFRDGADHELARRQLLIALGAPPEPAPTKPTERSDWFLAHPYPMPPNFTGRMFEREMLTRWLGDEKGHRLLVLRALGGFGKSALVWHWLLNDVSPREWPQVVFWSFYEGDASFDHFLVETLVYLTGDKSFGRNFAPRQQVDKLLAQLNSPGKLLILDGFERALRAFGGLNGAYRDDYESSNFKAHDRDCTSPLAGLFLRSAATLPDLRTRILITTRLRPRSVEDHGELISGCREEELVQMQPDDAVSFFRAQGIRGTHAEIEAACEPYGYHPLSLRLLAGRIVGDPQLPGDITAASRLDVSGDLVRRRHHVLEASYNSLAPERQKLLSRIACFRSPVSYDALGALAETGGDERNESQQPPQRLDDDLRDLVSRGLLQHDTNTKRFDLHPIVRRYAYDRLAGPDRDAAHGRLRDYFAAAPPPDEITSLDDLAPVIELYYHTVRAGQYDAAFDLFYERIHEALYYRFGAYQLLIDMLLALFPNGENYPPRLKKQSDCGWALTALANSLSLNGQSRRAAKLFTPVIQYFEDAGAKRNLAASLSNLSGDQVRIGMLRAAETSLQRSFEVAVDAADDTQMLVALLEKGCLSAILGSYEESETELAKAQELLESLSHIQAPSVVSSHASLAEMLLVRSRPNSVHGKYPGLAMARRALEFADETARLRVAYERDYIRAHWVLGAAHRIAENFDEAERHLSESLERCRRISMMDYEADILIDLARLRAATNDPDDAKRLAEEALSIADRCEYVLQAADAHLELAKLALARKDKPTALEHARKARELATCDGPSDYTYHAAYTEAGELLEGLEQE